MTGRHLAEALLALATGVAAWRLGWRQGHTIARYQAALDAVLDPSIDHSGCFDSIDRLSHELAAQTHRTAVVVARATALEDELTRLRGPRLLITPESLAFDEMIRREWGS